MVGQANVWVKGLLDRDGFKLGIADVLFREQRGRVHGVLHVGKELLLVLLSHFGQHDGLADHHQGLAKDDRKRESVPALEAFRPVIRHTNWNQRDARLACNVQHTWLQNPAWASRSVSVIATASFRRSLLFRISSTA